MKYLALYRKYRPTNFDEIAGQTELIKVIQNAITNNKISHAYLFSGPRGTGKTTTAKVIAKLVNCEKSSCGKPCGKCDFCMNSNNNNDIIEIDAASNNGVEEIRDIRDKITLAPNYGKYKVYIIDEVHMLTMQAFNALLKTLEEPPAHVIFILATTEPHKVPLTISSRCQKFNFRKLKVSEIEKRLTLIAAKENIKITQSAINEIACISDGGMRDAINLLDQLSVYSVDEITELDVDKITGCISYSELSDFFSYLAYSDKSNIIKFIESLEDNNINFNIFLTRIIEIFKDMLLLKSNIKNYDDNVSKSRKDIINNYEQFFTETKIIEIINAINDVSEKIKNSNYIKIMIVTAILSIFSNEEKLKFDNAKKDIIENKSLENLKDVLPITSEVDLDYLKKIRINNTFVTASKEKLKKFIDKWNQLDEYLFNDEYKREVGFLKDSIPIVVGNNNIILKSDFDSVSNNINKSLEMVEKIIEKIYNYKYEVIALNTTEWNREREKYIDNIKKGKKYQYIVEDKVKSDSESNNSSIKNLISVVGEEIIEYK